MDDKLKICKQTRQFAADALYKVLKDLLASDKPISEVTLRDAWLKEIQSNKEIFPEGWYDPPPHGIIVLFADDNNVKRVNFRNARFEENWPRGDIFLNPKKGLAFFYASPVHRDSGMIGDFQMSLYFGNNPKIQRLLQTCYTLDKEFFDYAQLGMKLSTVSKFANKRFSELGLSTEAMVLNVNANMNMGHSIPATDRPWTKEELRILRGKDWNRTKDMISKRRLSYEEFVIKPGFAFTIEPRPAVLDNPNLPTSLSYHTIALFKEDGSKELLTGFDELFKLAGMDYML